MSVSAEPAPQPGPSDRLKRLIVVSVKAKTFAQITALAEAEGTTTSDIVRRLVTKALARTARQLAMED